MSKYASRIILIAFIILLGGCHGHHSSILGGAIGGGAGAAVGGVWGGAIGGAAGAAIGADQDDHHHH